MIDQHIEPLSEVGDRYHVNDDADEGAKVGLVLGMLLGNVELLGLGKNVDHFDELHFI